MYFIFNSLDANVSVFLSDGEPCVLIASLISSGLYVCQHLFIQFFFHPSSMSAPSDYVLMAMRGKSSNG